MSSLMETTDSDEPHLRHVERDVLIPKLMREKAKQLCAQHVEGPIFFDTTVDYLGIFEQFVNLLDDSESTEGYFQQDGATSHIAFTQCCKDSGLLMVVKCREENNTLKQCLTKHYTDPVFYEECKQQYIKEKQEYERTGVSAKHRAQRLPTSM